MTSAPGVLRMDSPVGELVLAATGDGLTHVLFGHSMSEAPTGSADGGPIVAAAAAQLREYFAGTRRDFDLPLCPTGTDFQRAVWASLRDIPYGETRCYGELAARIGRPAAVRAVGAANGRNPISIIVPCHRVIGRNGTLTGYGGGLPAKRTLLALETPQLSL